LEQSKVNGKPHSTMSQPSPQSKYSNDPDLSGRQLGDFRLLRRLGEGAMAEVYLAEQESLKRQVAVKILKRRLADDVVYVKRFQREAQAAASLVHATIVQIHEVGHVGDLYYIAQEYVQGLNLRQWITRNGAPDLPLALLIMRQVAAALAKAAEQGIVHRDIKPENILLTRSVEVKVADFGLARLLREGEQLDLTEVGITLGTPLYMSPEQVEGRPLDPRSDIYSFGVTCYQMLAGSPPFSGETALSVAVQHLKKTPDPLENHRPDLPPALCRAIHKMLAKTPEGRFQSAKELLGELRRIQMAHLGEDPVADRTFDVSDVVETGVSWNAATQKLDALMKSDSQVANDRPRWWAWTMATALAVACGVGLAWKTMQPASVLAGVANSRPPIPKEDTVYQQWLYASQVGTIEAWQSILDYFRDEKYAYYHNHARRQMSRICIREGNMEGAMRLFEQLVDLGDLDDRAFGLVGECYVFTAQKRYRESADKLNELWQIKGWQGRLQDPTMKEMLQYVLRTNRAHLGSSMSSQEWQKWLDAPAGSPP
jgi:serine/threonine-protein kinase